MQKLNTVELIKNEGITVNNIITWWNQISTWTSSSILYEPTNKLKLSMIKLFLNVIEKLIELRNYSSTAQIISGITHHSISRLTGLQEVSKTNFFPSL